MKNCKTCTKQIHKENFGQKTVIHTDYGINITYLCKECANELISCTACNKEIKRYQIETRLYCGSCV